MIITCIADLHGHHPELPGGDLLIVAGDLTASDTMRQYLKFFNWIQDQKYKKIVFISGNHDNFMQNDVKEWKMKTEHQNIVYLCDSGTEFEGLKIWGTPWTKTFKGMNPHCKAFTCDTEEELSERFKLIPDDIDILISHGPSFGMLDKNINDNYVGSRALDKRILDLKLKLHIFGHIHEAYGQCHQYYLSENGDSLSSCLDGHNFIPFGHLSINCSIMNEKYQPVNKPITIEI